MYSVTFARAYEAIVEGGSVGGAERLRATASLVLALASSGKGSDSEKAERWATRLPDVSASGAGAGDGGDGEGQELDADALEKGATLRALSRRLAQPVKAAKHAMEEKKKLPNPNRVAKKRAKRREAHVAKLQERLKDAPQGEKMKDPDPVKHYILKTD